MGYDLGFRVLGLCFGDEESGVYSTAWCFGLKPWWFGFGLRLLVGGLGFSNQGLGLYTA